MGRKPQTKKSATRAKTPRTPKTEKPRTPKPDKAQKSAAAAKAAVGHNSMDPKLRQLFLEHKNGVPNSKTKIGVDKLKAALATANSNLRAAYKEALRDGFTKAQFDVARQLATPEGEAKFKAEIAESLLAARYVGSDIGAQLDMFLEPVRTDSTERAYDEGQKQSMENQPAKPDYAPGTAQFESYMKGFHDHQAGIASGFQTLDKGAKTQTEQKRRQRAAAPAEEPNPGGSDAPPESDPPPPPPPANDPPANPPTSGQPLSRAEYNRMQQAGDEPQSQFSRRN